MDPLPKSIVINPASWALAMHASMKWLIGEIIFLAVSASLLGVLGYPLVLPYIWYLLLHILGVVLFVGNIIVSGVWMLLSERAGKPDVLRFSVVVVNWADVFFTAPGIILIVLNGLTLATQWGGIFGVFWVTAGATLFAMSGVVWGVFLIRYQDKMIKIISEEPLGTELSAEFYSILHSWYFWGLVATILPVVTMMLMVVKPPI